MPEGGPYFHFIKGMPASQDIKQQAEMELLMRLDKYLKISRLIKRRTVANEACDAGRVLVNGKTAKASATVKPGDIIEINFGTKAVKVKVLNIQETVKKEEAAELYQFL